MTWGQLFLTMFIYVKNVCIFWLYRHNERETEHQELRILPQDAAKKAAHKGQQEAQLNKSHKFKNNP